jgi:DNA-binding transcriptional LysR family regulator
LLSEIPNDEVIMELRQLKTFLAVSQVLSFNRAAGSLHYAQSTVSAQIKALEDELDVPLFDRLGKRVVLTEAGERLVRYAGKILDLEAAAISDVSGRQEPEGSIAIRIPQSLGAYFLPHAIELFHRKFSKVGFDISSCAVVPLQQELRAGIIDAAFLLAESINASDLTAEVLGFTQLIFVCAPGHPLAAKPKITFDDLGTTALLLPKHDCSYKVTFEQELAQERIKPAVVMELNSLEALKRCVMRGVGITIIPKIAVRKELAAGDLVILSWQEHNLETAILLTMHKNKWVSPSLKAFIDAFRNVVRSASSD